MRSSRAKILILLLICLTALCFSPALGSPAQPSYDLPKEIDPSVRYLFFLHNLYVEKFGPSKECDYHGILKAFSDSGFRVISEVRPLAVPNVYAEKVARQVTDLLEAGVPPENITVCGHSKGAFIALWVSKVLQNPGVNFVVMAGCRIGPLGPAPQPLMGRFLSIYDQSDKIAGSCGEDFARAEKGLTEKEITVDTGQGHRVFFVPRKEWLEPVVNWINGQ